MRLQQTMKAITIPRPGDIDILDLTDAPVPSAAPDQILIKVEKAGVNFIDTYLRNGLYPLPSFPAVQGVECAGTIAVLPTDDAVLNNPEYKKRAFQLGGKVAASKLGSWAEYIAVPWSAALPVPDAVSTTTAAAATLQGLTALTFMTEAHDVRPGETVLIHAAAGGLGLLMVQLARARGAVVIGTTSTDEKAALAREAGAHHVVVYTREDTVARVREITGGRGVQAVFDGVGKDTFETSMEVLARKGTFVSVGNASGPVPAFAPLRLSKKNLKLVRPLLDSYISEPEESQAYGTALFADLASGALRPRVHREYPFSAEGARDAQRDLTSGRTTGKLILDVAGAGYGRAGVN